MPIKKPLPATLPSLKQILEALEKDFSVGLSNMQDKSYSHRYSEAIDTLKELNLSPERMMAFTAHMLVRIGDARSAIQSYLPLEYLISHSIDLTHKNRQSASKPRNRKSKDLRTEIQHIMWREKRQDLTFETFLLHGLKGHIEGLTIQQLSNGKYKLFTENVSTRDAVKYKKTTLSRWYYTRKK